jgi:hypothetical protein
MSGTFREHSRDIEGTIQGHLGNIQGTFCKSLELPWGKIMGLYNGGII